MSDPNNEILKITPAVSEAQVYESIRAALANARTRTFIAIYSAMVLVKGSIIALIANRKESS